MPRVAARGQCYFIHTYNLSYQITEPVSTDRIHGWSCDITIYFQPFFVYPPKGKDRIIFVTKEDHEAPSNAELIADDPNDPYEDQG